MTAQTSLCQTWSETLKRDFSHCESYVCLLKDQNNYTLVVLKNHLQSDRRPSYLPIHSGPLCLPLILPSLKIEIITHLEHFMWTGSCLLNMRLSSVSTRECPLSNSCLVLVHSQLQWTRYKLDKYRIYMASPRQNANQQIARIHLTDSTIHSQPIKF